MPRAGAAGGAGAASIDPDSFQIVISIDFGTVRRSLCRSLACQDTCVTCPCAPPLAHPSSNRAPVELRARFTAAHLQYGTAYAIAFRPPGGAADVSRIDINCFKPGDKAAGVGDKALTAILLKNDAPKYTIDSFGADARSKFAELCDDGKQGGYLYFEHFKMAMAPGKRDGRKPKDVTVEAAGAVSRQPLSLPVSKTLEFVRLEAMERLHGLHGAVGIDPKKIGWVLTVPAIWDDEAKHFMRTAAKDAGIISDLASNQLVLALEPEGAIIASMVEAAPAVREKFLPGTPVMVADCGGGTVDITISEVRSAQPLQLIEILPASGGPWGGTYVDQEMTQFVNGLLGDDFRRIDRAGHVTLLDKWEDVKVRFLLHPFFNSCSL